MQVMQLNTNANKDFCEEPNYQLKISVVLAYMFMPFNDVVRL